MGLCMLQKGQRQNSKKRLYISRENKTRLNHELRQSHPVHSFSTTGGIG